jgi:cytochrome c biogenesis protein CcdA
MRPFLHSIVNNQLISQQNQNEATPIKLTDYLTLRGGESIADVYDQPAKIVNLIVSNLFVVAGIIIFFLIIGAGFSFIKGSSQGKEEAKNLLTGAVIGFLIMFSAYWIIQIIKFVTGADIPI